jgi:hypothetical protein
MKFKYVKESPLMQNDLELILLLNSEILVSRCVKGIQMSGLCEF